MGKNRPCGSFGDGQKSVRKQRIEIFLAKKIDFFFGELEEVPIFAVANKRV